MASRRRDLSGYQPYSTSSQKILGWLDRFRGTHPRWTLLTIHHHQVQYKGRKDYFKWDYCVWSKNSFGNITREVAQKAREVHVSSWCSCHCTAYKRVTSYSHIQSRFHSSWNHFDRWVASPIGKCPKTTTFGTMAWPCYHPQHWVSDGNSAHSVWSSCFPHQLSVWHPSVFYWRPPGYTVWKGDSDGRKIQMWRLWM